MKLTIHYFASSRTSLPTSPASESIESPTPTLTLSALRALLIQRHGEESPEFVNVLARSAWSVDREMVDVEEEGNVVLKGGEEVCVIPPVSGG